MTDMTSKLISNTYKQVILVSSSASNTGVNTSLKAVQTGDGTNTALQIAQAAATIGIESEVVPEGATREIVFSDEIEAIRQNNPSLFENAGEDANAFSGEEYRQMLRQGLENKKSLIENSRNKSKYASRLK